MPALGGQVNRRSHGCSPISSQLLWIYTEASNSARRFFREASWVIIEAVPPLILSSNRFKYIVDRHGAVPDVCRKCRGCFLLRHLVSSTIACFVTRQGAVLDLAVIGRG